MFLPDTAASAAMRSVGTTSASITGRTTFGPPSHPNESISIGNSGVSIMPSVNPPPSSIGGQTIPFSRINSRKQVLLEKNPRVGLHYCVEFSDPESPPDVGDLCFVDTQSAGGWNHPKMFTLQQVQMELCRVWNASPVDTYVENLKQRFKQLSALGVFNTDTMDPKLSYSGVHVAIDVQRYAVVQDYWPIDVRAGDRLWLCFVCKNKEGTAAVEPGAKRSNCKEVSIFCLTARGYAQAENVLTRDAKAYYDASAQKIIGFICVGMVQNRLPADPLVGSRGRICRFDAFRMAERKREVHLCLNENTWINK